MKYNIKISLKAIWRIIKSLGFSRKKITKLNNLKNTNKNKNIRKLCAFSFVDLIKENKKFIFVDETAINLHTNFNYSYSRRGEKCYLNCPGKGSNTSIINAIDEEGLICYQIFDGGLKSEDFIYFIFKLTKILIKKKFSVYDFVIIFDGARSHTSELTKTFLPYFNYLKLSPYTPQFNSIEYYFYIFKNKFRMKFFEKKKDLRKNIILLTNFHKNDLFLKYFLKSLKFCIKAIKFEDFD